MTTPTSWSWTGSLSDEVTAMELDHRAFCRHAAAQGMVLLKNEGIFPIPAGSRLALYGGGACYTVKGGTGSGAVNNRSNVSVYEGIVNAGYTVTTKAWLDTYMADYAKTRDEWEKQVRTLAGDPPTFDSLYKAHASHPMEMPKGSPITADEISEEDRRSTPALYVISRISGEGADRTFSKGDYLLSDTEEAELRAITGIYENVGVILNVGGVIDLSFMDRDPVKGLLLMSQAGMEGGNALADILTGQVGPSGKLTDSWACDYYDYPSSANFSHNNGNVIEEKYTEGIYVGYRYFDTFQAKPRYPFGFGLSYTTFRIDAGQAAWRGAEDNGEAAGPAEVILPVTVTNTGNTAGREVVQIYVSCPWGLRRKELKRLVAFGKTPLLSPGEACELELSFTPGQLASYHTGRASWYLDAGSYYILVGNASDQTVCTGKLTLSETFFYPELHNICPLLDALKEISPEEPAARECRDSYEAESVRSGFAALDLDPVLRTEAAQAEFSSGAVENEGDPAQAKFPSGAAADPAQADNNAAQNDKVERIAAILASLTLEEKAQLVCGQPENEFSHDTGNKPQDQEEGPDWIGSAGIRVPGAAAQTTDVLLSKGVPTVTLADGPAGIRILQSYETDPSDGRLYPMTRFQNLENRIFGKTFRHEGSVVHYQFCSAIPVGTLLAQTFDEELVRQAGELIAREMKEFRIGLWLAPGMNIHRNPLCGRNFEYYSEDPLVSGKMAAAITKGVQEDPTCGTTIKHFACNNQEENRRGVSSIVSERALREIYLKGFEIAVKEAQPRSIMTSYNKVNNVHTANSYDLCTTAARTEWGFKGVIMTDWTTTNQEGGSSAAKCIAAGNDLVMPGLHSDIQEIIDAVNRTGDQSLAMEVLDAAVCRILSVIL
ncbi:MAG: glycoside hydrolase family 3 C-terminal domain-containing protein [Blautia sp.]|nr:glycoside hydrolase family 3 C-terminal domain-containing protein [Blautia sp.]